MSLSLLRKASELEQAYALRSTGVADLDLYLQGWPQAGVVELQLSDYGCGELSVLAPLLKEVQHMGCWINAPFLPSPDWLLSRGIELDKFWFVKGGDKQQAFWCADQCLRSGACELVLLWGDGLSYQQVRRLQLLAKEQGALCFLLHCAQRSGFPVALRLAVGTSAQGIHVNVLKNQKGQLRPGIVIGHELLLEES